MVRLVAGKDIGIVFSFIGRKLPFTGDSESQVCYLSVFVIGGWEEFFYPTSANNPIFRISANRSPLYESIHTIFLRHSMSGVVLTLGAILALTALVWRPKSIRDFPMSLGLIVVGSIAPYAFLWNGGYAPRFSIHFLPIIVFVFGICFKSPFKEYEMLKRYMNLFS